MQSWPSPQEAHPSWGGDDPTIEGFDCTAKPHTYDQQVVQCDHRGIKKHVAFVYRTPSEEPTS